MKRKITYCFLALLISIATYFGLRLAFGIFTPYNYFTAKHDIKEGKIQMIVVGLPSMPKIKQELAKKYGFNFKYIGCAMTPALLNGSDYYNNVVQQYLTDKYGPQFWDKFYAQAERNHRTKLKNLTLEKVTDLVEKQEIVQDKIKLIDSLSGHQRHLSLLPFLNEGFHKKNLPSKSC